MTESRPAPTAPTVTMETETPPTLELRRPVVLAYRVGPDIWIDQKFVSSLPLFRQLEKLAHEGGKVLALSEFGPKGWGRCLTRKSVATLNLYLRGMQGFACWQRANGGGFRHTSRHGWETFKTHLAFDWVGWGIE